jgi:precorrin-6B methylase 2
MLQAFKTLLFPSEVGICSIWGGIYQGLKFYIDFKHQTQFFLGLWERETHFWIKKLCQGIVTAIDVGAAAGEQTIYMLEKTTAIKVFTFEPDSTWIKELQKNLEANQLQDSPKLTLIQKFCSNQNTPHNTTLDEWISHIQTPCFIKIDIEGGEVVALQGASQLLKKSGARWLVETHSQAHENACLEIFKKFEYKTHIIKNAWWRRFIPEKRPIGFNRWLVAYKIP